MRESGRVDNQALYPSNGILDGFDNFTLMVGLERGDPQAQFCGFGAQGIVDIVQCPPAVVLRFAFSQHVEVGTMDHENGFFLPTVSHHNPLFHQFALSSEMVRA